jgi:hypothetical protein
MHGLMLELVGVWNILQCGGFVVSCNGNEVSAHELHTITHNTLHPELVKN